ncbi:MAG: Na/Pi symporter [Flammeovirgaceae bacterium]|nr:Na/Pi symporter [Flammeovirgaceae bacterium]
MESTELNETTKPFSWQKTRQVLYIIGTLLLFLFALDLMVSSLQHLGKSTAEAIILATSNPFTGLFIGLLITAIIQSSSTTTALTVALVASGSVTIESAVPIIMGANIGTTITSTIVALGFINKKKEFRRAVAAGTFHDFFNILTVIVLFPLEYYFGFLSSLAASVRAYLFTDSSGTSAPTLTSSSMFSPLVDFLVNNISSGFVLVVMAFVLLFGSILLFRKIISDILAASSPEKFSRFFFKNQIKSFFWGIVTTAAIRSSTITTSVVVPIVAKKIVSLKNAAPFIMGANIGTTITVFIAAALNNNSSSAITIALVHFLFNLIGVLLFFPIPFLRQIPIKLASDLGRITLRYRLAGLVYILTTFFFIPFSLIYFNRGHIEEVEVLYEQHDHVSSTTTRYRLVSKINTKTSTGEWVIYNGIEASEEPALIFPVYKKNDVLFINNQMRMFAQQGFCWDEDINQKKIKNCVAEILGQLRLSGGLIFDSVFVFKKQSYDSTNTLTEKFYISPLYPVILKQETWKNDSVLIKSEEILRVLKQ